MNLPTNQAYNTSNVALSSVMPNIPPILICERDATFSVSPAIQREAVRELGVSERLEDNYPNGIPEQVVLKGLLNFAQAKVEAIFEDMDWQYRNDPDLRKEIEKAYQQWQASQQQA